MGVELTQRDKRLIRRLIYCGPTLQQDRLLLPVSTPWRPAAVQWDNIILSVPSYLCNCDLRVDWRLVITVSHALKYYVLLLILSLIGKETYPINYQRMMGGSNCKSKAALHKELILHSPQSCRIQKGNPLCNGGSIADYRFRNYLAETHRALP